MENHKQQRECAPVLNPGILKPKIIIDGVSESFRKMTPDIHPYMPDYIGELFCEVLPEINWFSDFGNELSKTQYETLINKTNERYFDFGKRLAPVFTFFVKDVLSGLNGTEKVLFPARDATKFFRIACQLIGKFPSHYPQLTLENFSNPLFSRAMFEIVDEEIKESAEKLTDKDAHLNLAKRYQQQQGLGAEQRVIIVDTGTYGTMIDKIQNQYPNQYLGVSFFFSAASHIFGFVNQHGNVGVDMDGQEVFEAARKLYWATETLPVEHNLIPPTALYEVGHTVHIDMNKYAVNNPLMRGWYDSATAGITDYISQLSQNSFNELGEQTLTAILNEILNPPETWTGFVKNLQPRNWSKKDEWAEMHKNVQKLYSPNSYNNSSFH